MTIKKLIVLILTLIVLAIGTVFYFAQREVGQDGEKDSMEQGGITLKGDENVKLYAGDPYEEPGATAKDKDGKDVSDKIQISKVNLNHSGIYTVTYTVSLKDGQQFKTSRTITVSPKPAGTDDRGLKTVLPILMYHDVYDKANPPENLNANFIEKDNLNAHMDYLANNGYYFPSWKEVRDYVDGKIELPEKSVVITFDDGAPGFKEYGVPILEEHDVYATAFIITGVNGVEWASNKFYHINLQSHSDNMHRAGGNIGHGGILTALSEEEITMDLKKSADILGTHDAFAYPFGDFTDDSYKAVKKAGFLLAVTTQYGKAEPGDNPYYLPRVRVNGGLTVDQLAASIS